MIRFMLGVLCDALATVWFFEHLSQFSAFVQ
jgi:hypothetical protein